MPNILLIAILIGLGACSDDSTPVADLPQSLDRGLDVTVPGERSALDRPGAGERPRDTASARDGVAVSCTGNVPAGGGSVSGTVNGQPVTASNAVAVKMNLAGLKGYAIGLIDVSGSCASVPAWVPTAKLALQICGNLPGTYAVGGSCKPDGGGTGVWLSNSIKIPQTGADISAKSGSITLESYDESCGGKVKGSFTATFANGSLSGTFDTVSCGEVKL